MERPQPARRGARARQPRALRLLNRDSQRSGAQARYMRKPAHEVDAAVGTWEHGLPPKRGGLSLVQCPSMGHGATTAGAARRARAASARAAPPPQREAAQWRTSALHAQAGSRSGRRSWHVGARPCTEEGRPLARAVPFHRAWSDHSRRGAARARGKRACCASSPKRGSAVAHKRATRASRLTKWTPQLARGSTALHRRRAASRSCSALPWGMERPQPARRSARARQAHVLRLLPRERQRSGAQARYTRKPAHEVGAAAGTWEHGLAPKKGGLSLVQCPSIGHGATTASAARRARAATARAAPPPQRQPAQWRTSALHAQAGSRSGRRSWHVGARPCTEEGRPLARAVPFHGAWSDHSRRGAARARGKRPYLRLLPRERQRSGAQARYTRKPAHEVGTAAGTWEHGLAPKKGGLSLVQCPFIGHGATTASAARRARAASARAAPPPQREPAQWRTSALHAQAASRSGRRGWHVGARPCTEEGRPLARAVPFHGRGATAAGASQRARAASARAAPPPQREAAQWRTSALHAQAGSRSGAAAGTWEHGLAPKKGGPSLVQCPSIGHGATTAGACSARARQARVLRLLPTERQRSGAEVRYTHKPAHEVGAAAGTWEHGLAPKNGGLSLVQCPFIGHGATTASAARRARAASARAAPPPQRQPAQWRTSALHAQAGSRSEGRSWHVGARPCTEEGRPLARAVPFHRAWSDHSRRSLRRARAASARAAPPPQREAAQWRTSALHAQAGSRSARRSWHVGARPCTEEGRPLARAVPFHGAWSDHSQSGAARARGKRACCASSQERGSAVAHKRATRASRLTKWAPQLSTWEHGLATNRGAPSLVQCPSIGHGATTAGAAQRARAASARAAPPPQREAAQWRTSALHAQACSRSGRRSWHVGARPSTEEGRPLACAVPFHRAWSDRSQRSAARARGKRARCASSPERASAVAHKRATRASRLTKWTPQLARGSTALHRRRAAPRSCSALP